MTVPNARRPRSWYVPLAVLAALVYVPLLLTDPGQVLADTKTYLYLDPGRLLGRAVSMWDPHVGLGTVPHQQIGYLWPAGPWYWAFEQLGVPDWIAQRLWLGTIMFGAGAGVLYLGRTWRWRPTAATAAAFAYALTPFVLTLAARISVLLLPFAGLPWMIALTVRASHTRGWRYPALFGLVVVTVGSVNATTLLLVGLAPVLWLLYAAFAAKDISTSRAATTAAKIAAVTVPVNLWWIAGLSVQATDGIDVLQYSETAQVVAESSTSHELLRGIGYWFFYGGDRLGPWIEPSVDYTQRIWLIALSYAIPVAGLLALGIVRWRHRTYLIGMLAVGLVLAVGAHPWGSPPPVAALIKAFLLTDVGLAMRSLPRAVPLIALALALGIGALIGALAEQVPRRGMIGAVVVAMVAYAALPPLWMREMAPENLQRPEELPEYWHEAAAHLDTDEDTRVLGVPGTDFASFRWGNSVDAVLPGLIDRPYVARELIPYGTPASAQLLNALDLRLQEGTMPPSGLAAVARLMAVGDVFLRNDLQYERFNTPRPRSLYALLDRMPGLGDPTTFGAEFENVAGPEAPLLDELHLVTERDKPAAPALATFPVEDPRPIVRTSSVDQQLLLSGDGYGLVDTAMAGLIDGDELIRYSAELTDDPDFVRTHLRGERALVVTDTNRKRAVRWTTVRHTQGYTETEDGGLLSDDRTDNRLPVLPDRPGTRTVAEHRGLGLRATDYGNPATYTPEERAANAADGDPTTAWRVAAFDDAVGHRLELEAPAAVTTDHITLLQPQTGLINRWLTEVELTFDGDDPMRVELDDSSRTPPGQRIDLGGERTFRRLSIEILADTAGRRPGYDGLNSVGFAEVDVEGLTVDEVIRMPSDLLETGGFRTRSYPLALVQTRLRSIQTDVTRTDEEYGMARAVDLPATRDYALRGSARLSARAPSEVLDALLGRAGLAAGEPRVTGTTTLPGGLSHLASNALDGDPDTVWTTTFAPPPDQGLRVQAPGPTTVSEVDLLLVADELHSTPASVRVLADGADVANGPLTLEPAGDGRMQATVALPEPITATTFEVQFPELDERRTMDWYSEELVVMPIAVAELGLGDLAVGPVADQVDTGCREDLVTIDDEPVPVRISGPASAALAGDPLDLALCEAAVTIPGGDRVMRTAEGRETGLDLDQLVWRSDAGGAAPTDLGAPLLGDAPTAPDVRIDSEDDATVRVRVDGAEPGQPFWLVLGQSHSPGWSFLSDDAEAEGTQLVDGYANGFLVTPDASSFEATLRFTPQNRVEVGLLVSAIAAVGALVLVLLPARELRPLPIPLQEPIRRLRALTWEGALPTRRDARRLGVIVGVVSALVITWPIGIAVGVATWLAARRETWRPVFTVLPAALLAAAAGYVLLVQLRNEIPPGLDWTSQTGRVHPLGLTAVTLLVVDVAIAHLWSRRSDYR